MVLRHLILLATPVQTRTAPPINLYFLTRIPTLFRTPTRNRNPSLASTQLEAEPYFRIIAPSLNPKSYLTLHNDSQIPHRNT
jgi:hypothetical protein